MTQHLFIPRQRPFRALLALGAFVALNALLPVTAGGASTETAAQEGRVVLVGFDGADSRTTRRMIDEGRLPNLAGLAKGGTFAPLISTNPAESAAGWAALNTGTNPVKNGVPSFIKRNTSGTQMPAFGHIYQEDMVIEIPSSALVSGLVAAAESLPFEPNMAMGLLVTLAGVLGFMFVLRGLLKVKLELAVALSVLISLAGGYAGMTWMADRSTGGSSDSLASNTYEVPQVFKNAVTQPGFWDIAARGGKRAIVLDAALAFDQETVPGARVLAGLGLPDVRGAGNGNWFIYTTEDTEVHRAPKGWVDSKGSGTGTTFRVDERGGKIVTAVYGPVNFTKKAPLEAQIAEINESLKSPDLGWKTGGELRDKRKALEAELKGLKSAPHDHRVSLPMTLERRGEELAITINGDTQTAVEGGWTDWFRLPFELAPGLVAGGLTRARVMELGEVITVYLHTFDIDPENPPIWQQVGQPAGFAGELAGWAGGPYETLGWSCMTNQLKDKKLPVEVFLEDVEFTMKWRRRLTHSVLDRDDWDVLFSVFSTTDRVQHMMYKYHDPDHPFHDPEESARVVDFFGKPTALKDIVPAIYEQMDVTVGEILAKLDPADTLMLCADHGFTSYRRGLEVNNWLESEGYLTLKPGNTKTNNNMALLAADWSKTKAYSLGLGMIYVNMEGRERGGIVPKGEAKALLAEIGAKLVALRDAGSEEAPFDEPQQVVLDYAIMDDLYQGPQEWGRADYPCADMQVGFAEYYRASWGTVSGKLKLVKNEAGAVVPGPMFKDNSNNWSGDHASNSPHLVTGIFFSSKPVQIPADGVSVMHIAPTVLESLGVPIPENFDLPALARK
ncbi:MAG: alkaline phosphatase family protein [bacterium]